MLSLVETLKNKGKQLVFTNGCFDLIHLGHIRLLKKARSLGDCLIVGLNTDASIKRIKGSKRPLLDQKQRSQIVASFESVDYVTFFEEDTPEEMIRKIAPDILVKGGEYQMHEVVGRESVWNSGGKVYVIKPFKGRSTSRVIEDIKNRFS